MDNLQISQIFRDIAKILEIKGENPFRIRAYEKAAQNIEGLTDDITVYIKEDRLTDIPGIGKDLSEKIKEFISTGRIKAYEALKKTVPEGILDLLKIPSIGPKTARLLYEQLKINNVDDLEKAIKQGRLKGIFGIKEKTIENISKGIELFKKGRERMTLAQAIQVADEFINNLKKIGGVKKITPAGSLRRQKETVRDIDILIISESPKKIMDAFVRVPSVKEILAKGQTKASVRTKDDVQVDCRVEKEESFGAALLYFTGSKNFNIKLRMIAQRMGLKINEYGIFKGDVYIAGKTEEEMFKALGLSYIEPELREDTGEIELAKENKLPDLIELKDIKADLHVHSNFSDGTNTIEEIVKAAQARNYSYIAITDHSQGLKVAGGLSPKELARKRLEIDRINKNLKGFKVLYATEVDIDSQGRLDYPDSILKEFDVVVAAIHAGFKQSKEQLSRRLIKACMNKYVNIIAHPTGRLWGVRQGYDLDFTEVFKVARETNTFLEINSFPNRLDLNDLNSRRAKEAGVKLVISTDAHNIEQLDAIQLGVAVARRGWLEDKDVINTLNLEDFFKTIREGKGVRS